MSTPISAIGASAVLRSTPGMVPRKRHLLAERGDHPLYLGATAVCEMNERCARLPKTTPLVEAHRLPPVAVGGVGTRTHLTGFVRNRSFLIDFLSFSYRFLIVFR